MTGVAAPQQVGRRVGMSIVAVVSALQLLTIAAQVGAPLQPLVSVLFVLTCPGFFVLDMSRPRDLSARLLIGVTVSAGANIVIFAVLAIGNARWLLIGALAASAVVAVALRGRFAPLPVAPTETPPPAGKTPTREAEPVPPEAEPQLEATPQLAPPDRQHALDAAGPLTTEAPVVVPPAGEPTAVAPPAGEPTAVVPPKAEPPAIVRPATRPPPVARPETEPIPPIEDHALPPTDDLAPPGVETHPAAPAGPAMETPAPTPAASAAEPVPHEDVPPAAPVVPEAVRPEATASEAAATPPTPAPPGTPSRTAAAASETAPVEESETTPLPPTASARPDEPASETSRHTINVNTASAVEIATLPGVGMAIAQRMVDHRNRHGAFVEIGDLLDVSGIGERKLAGFMHLVVMENVTP